MTASTYDFYHQPPKEIISEEFEKLLNPRSSWSSESIIASLPTKRNISARILANALIVTTPALVFGSQKQESTVFQLPIKSETYYSSVALDRLNFVNQHFACLFNNYISSSIVGFSEAVYKLLWSLSEIIAQYSYLALGFQITDDESLILSVGTKSTDSVMAEFFYDKEANDFEKEVSIISRQSSLIKASIVNFSDVATKIEAVL